MKAEEFVKHWKVEKEQALERYTSGACTEVAGIIKRMGLSEKQIQQMKTVIDCVLTDTHYSLLLGLDGCGSIGGMQQTFKIFDESGSLISECGDLESEAWEQFHGGNVVI